MNKPRLVIFNPAIKATASRLENGALTNDFLKRGKEYCPEYGDLSYAVMYVRLDHPDFLATTFSGWRDEQLKDAYKLLCDQYCPPYPVDMKPGQSVVWLTRDIPELQGAWQMWCCEVGLIEAEIRRRRSGQRVMGGGGGGNPADYAPLDFMPTSDDDEQDTPIIPMSVITTISDQQLAELNEFFGVEMVNFLNNPGLDGINILIVPPNIAGMTEAEAAADPHVAKLWALLQPPGSQDSTMGGGGGGDYEEICLSVEFISSNDGEWEATETHGDGLPAAYGETKWEAIKNLIEALERMSKGK